MAQVSLLAGAVWGIVGAATMVVVMQLLGGDSPPPFAVFWAEFVGDGDPEAAMPAALSIHGLYALVAGAVYVVVFGRFDLGFAIDTITGGVLWGIVYAIVLLAGGAVVWVNIVLDLDPSQDQMMSMAAAHLGYGLTLGILTALVPGFGVL